MNEVFARHFTYLKERNFHGKKISRISRILAKFAKKIPFLTPENIDSRKLIPAKQALWLHVELGKVFDILTTKTKKLDNVLRRQSLR